MVDTLIMLVVVLAIVLIAVSIIKAAAKFLLKLGVFALLIFLAFEAVQLIR